MANEGPSQESARPEMSPLMSPASSRTFSRRRLGLVVWRYTWIADPFLRQTLHFLELGLLGIFWYKKVGISLGLARGVKEYFSLVGYLHALRYIFFVHWHGSTLDIYKKPIRKDFFFLFEKERCLILGTRIVNSGSKFQTPLFFPSQFNPITLANKILPNLVLPNSSYLFMHHRILAPALSVSI